MFPSAHYQACIYFFACSTQTYNKNEINFAVTLLS